MSQSFTNLLYHLIFSTKERRPLIKLTISHDCTNTLAESFAIQAEFRSE